MVPNWSFPQLLLFTTLVFRLTCGLRQPYVNLTLNWVVTLYYPYSWPAVTPLALTCIFPNCRLQERMVVIAMKFTKMQSVCACYKATMNFVLQKSKG